MLTAARALVIAELPLTALGFVLHLGGVITRGLAAGRVPWGNMYEFSITASLAVAIVYLIFVQRYKLQWLGLGVTFVPGIEYWPRAP